jgi:hypothetical protein
MIEMQMAQHHRIDVFMPNSARSKRIEQYMAFFENSISAFEFWFEERADTGFKEHCFAINITRKQTAASQFNPVFFIGRQPPRPERSRRIAEHGAAIQSLPIAFNRPKSQEMLPPKRAL